MRKSIQLILRLCSVLLLATLSTGAWAQSFVKIVMDQAGSLSDKLTAVEGPISALKVEGPINGDDVVCIRTLAGRSTEGTKVEPATLSHLDLRKAVLTEGGSKYLNEEGCMVQSDRVGRKMFAGTVLKWVKLPKNLSVLGEEAFLDCKDLQVIMGLDYYETIGARAFKNCVSLDDFYLDSALEIQEGAFANCKAIKSIGIKIDKIGKGAFEGCGLSFLSLEGTTDAMWNAEAFKDCKNLSGVELLGAVSLPNHMFSGCSALREVLLKGTPKTIGQGCFENCAALLSMDFPISMKSIGVDAFKGCERLNVLYADTPEGIAAEGAFETTSLSEKNLWVTSEALAAFQKMAPWNEMRIFDETAYPLVDKNLLEEDFEAYTAKEAEWEGNETWKCEMGAYINDIDGNKVLQLGDNESYGVITTAPMDLSGNRGKFYIQMDADGWNELHSSVLIEVKNKAGKVVYSTLFTVPQPEMGYTMKLFKLAMYGGSEETTITFSTSMQHRIFILDNMTISQASVDQPVYEVSSLNLLDFGRVKLDATAPDKFVSIFFKNMDMAPKTRIESTSMGIFSVDTEWNGSVGKARVMLATDKVGVYTGFLKIYSDDMNVIKVPIRAIIEDPENVYDLDDSAPVTELNEDFEAAARIPEGWKNVAVSGDQKWMMRTTGGVMGNRYPAIDALGDVAGDVHALLIMPAMNLSAIKADNKQLAFDLASVKTSGATLQLVYLKKTGETQVVKDLTATADFEWSKQIVDLSEVPSVKAGFLALEYKGTAHELATIYRVDNVLLEKKEVGIDYQPTEQLSLFIEDGCVWIEGLEEGSIWRIFTLNGVCAASGVVSNESPIVSLAKGGYILQVNGRSYKFIM